MARSRKGFGLFAPRIRKTLRRNGRRIFRFYSLFPRYLFVLDTEGKWRSLLDLDGIVGMLMAADEHPAWVPQQPCLTRTFCPKRNR